MFQNRNCFYRNLWLHPRIVDQIQEAHLFNFQALDGHAGDNIGKQTDHVIVTHGHVGDNLLEGNLLLGKVLVLLAAAVQLEA